MTLREVLDSGRWFRRRSWEGKFEPFLFCWSRTSGGKLLKATCDDPFDTKISERRFSPFDVLANDWEIVEP